MARTNHGERIAALETKLDAQTKAIVDHIDAKHELVLANLQPYRSLVEKVEKHSNQIAFWRGAQALLAFIFTGVLAYFGLEKH